VARNLSNLQEGTIKCTQPLEQWILILCKLIQTEYLLSQIVTLCWHAYQVIISFSDPLLAWREINW